jgi:hypothetical protein
VVDEGKPTAQGDRNDQDLQVQRRRAAGHRRKSAASINSAIFIDIYGPAAVLELAHMWCWGRT